MSHTGEVGRYLTKPFVAESRAKRKVRLVVAGTRGDFYEEFFEKTLVAFLKELMHRERLKPDDIEIVSGMASTGADLYGVNFAKKHGFALKPFPAAWDDITPPTARIKTNSSGKQYNANAGFDRNVEMARYGTHAIVFWDGRSSGSEHMISMAKQFGLATITMLLDMRQAKGRGYQRGHPTSKGGTMSKENYRSGDGLKRLAADFDGDTQSFYGG